MADISKIKLPGMVDAYDVKDSTARSAVAEKVAKAGDTMTGALTLSGAPTANLHAATKKYVDDSISAISGAMVFKGTVGEGGTIEWSALPAASASNKGWTYKVITAHATTPVCKVGDLIVSNANAWIVIPSGDEPSGTVTNIGTGTGLKGGPITTTGTISIDTDVVAQRGGGITGSVTPLGGNAASAVSFTGTVVSASKVKTSGSANTPTAIDTTKFSGGSLSAGSFSGGSGSFTQGTFTGGSGSFVQGTDVYQTTTYSVANEVLTITAGSFTQGEDTHTHVAATHGQDTHVHTAATHTQGTLTPAAIQDGFYTAGTAAVMPTFDSVSDIVTKSTTATAAAQTFTGASSAVDGTID